jgi:hypothetical protein
MSDIYINLAADTAEMEGIGELPGKLDRWTTELQRFPGYQTRSRGVLSCGIAIWLDIAMSTYATVRLVVRSPRSKAKKLYFTPHLKHVVSVS